MEEARKGGGGLLVTFHGFLRFLLRGLVLLQRSIIMSVVVSAGLLLFICFHVTCSRCSFITNCVLPVSVYQTVCVVVCLRLCLCLSLCIRVSASLSVSVCLCLSLFVSVYKNVCVSVCL